MELAASDLSMAADRRRLAATAARAVPRARPRRHHGKAYSLIVPAMPTDLPVKPRGIDPMQRRTTSMAMLAR